MDCCFKHIQSSPKLLQVFDSLYSSVNGMTKKLLTKLFGAGVVIEIGNCPQQNGAADCGVFAIATCVALANHRQPEKKVVQEKMRDHLVKCFLLASIYIGCHMSTLFNTSKLNFPKIQY